MAEFQEVAAQKKRMCNMYYNNGCNGCPLNNGDCGVLSARFADVDKFQRVETTVMSWAAEHPEPVYPSYLEAFGWAHKKTWAEIKDIIANPIPVDTAQKLGIEPKEC